MHKDPRIPLYSLTLAALASIAGAEERPKQLTPPHEIQAMPEGSTQDQADSEQTPFCLDGEDFDRVVFRLFKEEIKLDSSYLQKLRNQPTEEQTAILTENYEDLLAALHESRGGEYPSLEAAVESFRPYAIWLKGQVLEDPRDYLEKRAVFQVRERDIREFADLFVDAFSDEESVEKSLTQLSETDLRSLYLQLPIAAREALDQWKDQKFPTIEEKKTKLRETLFALRDQIAADPAAWLAQRRAEGS